MKIVNNNIYITRGETDTYNTRVIDKTTGAPFVLPSTNAAGDTMSKFLIVFSVRKSDYIKDGSAIKKYLWLSNNAKLVKTNAEDYPASEWGSHGEAFVPEKNVLYRRKTALGTYDYAYYDGKTWKDYSFNIKFPFLYNDTASLAPKAYKYAMTLYGGNNLDITEEGLVGIDYKKPLVDAQFIVEADINE